MLAKLANAIHEGTTTPIVAINGLLDDSAESATATDVCKCTH